MPQPGFRYLSAELIVSVTRDDAIALTPAERRWPLPAAVSKPVVGLGAAAVLIGLGWIVVAHNAPRQAAAPPAVAVPTMVATPAVETAPPPPELSVDELIARSPPHVGAPTNLPPQVAAAPRNAAGSTPDPVPSMDRYDVTVRVEKGDTGKAPRRTRLRAQRAEKATDALRAALRGPPVEGKGRNAKPSTPGSSAHGRRRSGCRSAKPSSHRRHAQADRRHAHPARPVDPTDGDARDHAAASTAASSTRRSGSTGRIKLMRASGVVNRSLRASYIAAGVPPAAAYGPCAHFTTISTCSAM